MKWLGAHSIAVFSAVAFGCSGGDRSSRTESDAEALLATVPVALAAPTGTVSPTTARALLDKWQSLQRVHTVFDAVLSLGTEAAQACLDGQPNAGTYDLLCLTMGQATGRLTFHAPAADGDAGLEGRMRRRRVRERPAIRRDYRPPRVRPARYPGRRGHLFGGRGSGGIVCLRRGGWDRPGHASAARRLFRRP